jgi:hypothetical protein
VRDKARPFIDKRPSDNLVGDKSTLEKMWFFYPGGQAVSNSNDYTSNPFACELQKRQFITNWTEQSQDSSDERTILMLEEQAGFSLRFLSMIREGRTRKALEDAQVMMEVDINTFISRVDVEFLPLEIEDSKKLNAVKVLFIESIVTGSLDLRNDCFVCAQASNGNIFSSVSLYSLRLPKQYRNAVYALYHNDSIQHNLRSENEKYTNNKMPDFLQKLYILLKNPGKYGLVLNEKEEQEIIWLIKEDYIKDRNLVDDWNSLYPENAISDNEHELSFEYIDSVVPDFPNIGWYCKKCGQFMGDERIGDKPDMSAPIRFKEIHICNL